MKYFSQSGTMEFCRLERSAASKIDTQLACRADYCSSRSKTRSDAAAVANIGTVDAISGHEVQPHVPGSSQPITHATHWRRPLIRLNLPVITVGLTGDFDSRGRRSRTLK